MNPLGRLSSSSTALLTLLVLLFPALIRAALDPFPPTGDFVVELDDVSFERDVQGRGEEDFYLVEFYSPACSHCRAFAPLYEEIGDSLRGIIPVGRISARDYKEIRMQYKVKEVPHVVLFVPGSSVPLTYMDERTVKDIVDWVFNALTEFDAPVIEVQKNHIDAFLNPSKKIYPSRYLMLNQGNVPVTWNLIHNNTKGKAVFGHIDSEKVNLQAFQKKYNVAKLPAIVAHLSRPIVLEEDEESQPEENGKHKGKSKASKTAGKSSTKTKGKSKSKELEATLDEDEMEIEKKDGGIMVFQGDNFMTAFQKVLAADVKVPEGHGVFDGVTTEGLKFSKLPPPPSFYEDYFLRIVAVVLTVLFCGFAVWAYQNRNKKVKEVVYLNAVTWDTGKKNID